MKKIPLPTSDEKLLAQCDVETFRSGGKGGQHVNKTSSAVRLRHRPSGITVTCRQERSQHRNKAICVKNLRAKIERLNVVPARRIKTRVPMRVKEKILDSKTKDSIKKKLRSKPRGEDA
ncbi:MAG TPA: peptide chain release factor-like protein [Nitrospiraceae bacterium]|nr:peptide chain release factor-like protein [Nitrospiraceae bacterium]